MTSLSSADALRLNVGSPDPHPLSLSSTSVQASHTNSSPLFQAQPEELMERELRFLDYRDLTRFIATCRWGRDFGTSEHLWRPLTAYHCVLLSPENEDVQQLQLGKELRAYKSAFDLLTTECNELRDEEPITQNRLDLCRRELEDVTKKCQKGLAALQKEQEPFKKQLELITLKICQQQKQGQQARAPWDKKLAAFQSDLQTLSDKVVQQANHLRGLRAAGSGAGVDNEIISSQAKLKTLQERYIAVAKQFLCFKNDLQAFMARDLHALKNLVSSKVALAQHMSHLRYRTGQWKREQDATRAKIVFGYVERRLGVIRQNLKEKSSTLGQISDAVQRIDARLALQEGPQRYYRQFPTYILPKTAASPIFGTPRENLEQSVPRMLKPVLLFPVSFNKQLKFIVAASAEIQNPQRHFADPALFGMMTFLITNISVGAEGECIKIVTLPQDSTVIGDYSPILEEQIPSQTVQPIEFPEQVIPPMQSALEDFGYPRDMARSILTRVYNVTERGMRVLDDGRLVLRLRLNDQDLLVRTDQAWRFRCGDEVYQVLRPFTVEHYKEGIKALLKQTASTDS